MLFSTWLGNVDGFLRPRHINTPIATSNAMPSGTPTPMPTFTASLDPLDDAAVLVLVAIVEVVEVVEAVAGEGEAELVTEEMVEEDNVELVVTEEVVEDDEVDELVVLAELPIVVNIEMEPAREKVPFPV
jgi:hypothetical protein